MSGGPPWPHHALVARRHHSDPFVQEALHALSLEGLGRIDVALGIDRDAVHAVEFAGLAPAAAKCRQLGERIAPKDAHALIGAVSQVDEALLRIFREGDFPRRSGSQRILLEEHFPDKSTI